MGNAVKDSLPHIEPEIRENRAEIEAACQDRLPELLCAKDIRKDLHSQTNASDGLTIWKTWPVRPRQRVTHTSLPVITRAARPAEQIDAISAQRDTGRAGADQSL